jgi:ATP-binding cassette subfamily B protein
MTRPQSLPQAWPGLKRSFEHFWPYLRQYRLLLIGALLALLAEVALRALEPWPLKYIFDHLFAGKHHSRLPSLPTALEGMSPAAFLTIAVLAIVVLTGLRVLADYASTIGFAVVGSRVLTKVRSQLFSHVQNLSLSFHNRAHSGDLILRVMSDVNQLKDVLVTAALPLIMNVLLVIVMLGVMFWINWRLALIALIPLPLVWLCTTSFSRKIHQAARKQRKREATMASSASETIGAIKIVQSLNLQELFADSFSRTNKKGLKADLQSTRLTAALVRAVGFLIVASTALVLWYGAQLVLGGELTPGELLVFMAYLKNAFRPIQDFAKYTGRLAKAAAAGDRVLELLRQTADVHDLPGAVPAPAFRGEIRLEGVSFAYEPQRYVLEQIDFEVKPGQQVALVGPSGIGKSTLVNLLLRFYDPQRGRILIDGRDIRDFTLASLRAQVSAVHQDTVLFAATVRDNIAFGAWGATPLTLPSPPGAGEEGRVRGVTAEEIETAARMANAHEFIQELPKGYETVLGERGVTLSGGQRQRIAVARAAVRKAPLLILDEPTTGLDEENERIVVEALERLAEGKTTILIAHDLRLAARADLVLYLENGRLLEHGSHRELLTGNGRYAALYRQQNAFVGKDGYR